MVDASRKKLVIDALVLLTAAAAVPLARQPIRDAVYFALLSPPEKKMVGEWKGYSIGGVIVTTHRPDHTWTSVGGCLDVTTNGRWSVDGEDIVYSLHLPRVDDWPSPAPVRVPVHDLVDLDQWVRSQPELNSVQK
jgi:hypothetical protein